MGRTMARRFAVVALCAMVVGSVGFEDHLETLQSLEDAQVTMLQKKETMDVSANCAGIGSHCGTLAKTGKCKTSQVMKQCCAECGAAAPKTSSKPSAKTPPSPPKAPKTKVKTSRRRKTKKKPDAETKAKKKAEKKKMKEDKKVAKKMKKQLNK